VPSWPPSLCAASCPNDCSGHGTCHTIEHIAYLDNTNEYKLWDREATMGCVCDAGYTGADCSLRQCKVGIDPLYTNLAATASLAAWKVEIKNPTSPGTNTHVKGTYAIKFYDAFGEDYVTRPIVHKYSNYCDDVTAALEALPNSIIPLNSVSCTFAAGPPISYTLTFTGNPGELKQIEVDTYLDGRRPTLFDARNTVTGGQVDPITVNVASAGATGEYVDHFTQYCEGVVATVTGVSGNARDYYVATLSVSTAYEARLLKQCLGDSDGNLLNNRDVENWDYGSWFQDRISSGAVADMVGRFPHAIKLVKKDRTDIYDSGHVYLAWYQNVTQPTISGSALDLFLLSRSPHVAGTKYYVFTTDAIAEQVGSFASYVTLPPLCDAM
jgi:hypothetical protein